jgi:hypothetical protein
VYRFARFFYLIIAIAIALGAAAVLAQSVGNGSSATNCGNGNCGGGAASTPTPYPVITPAAFPTPTGNGGAYAMPTSIPTNLPAVGAMGVGSWEGRKCVVQHIMYDAGPSATPTTTPAPDVVTLNPTSQLCTVNSAGDEANLTFSPNTASSLGGVPTSFSSYEINGVTYALSPTVENDQYRLGRAAGQVYTATTCCVNNHNHTFTITTLSDSALLTAADAPVLPMPPGYLGAFAREEGGGSPQNGGMFSATSPNVQPSPYPTPNPALLFGAGSYCDSVTANGYSIAALTGGFLLDYNKIKDVVQVGASWTRSEVYNFSDDHSHLTPVGSYLWGSLDSLICGELRNSVIPEIGLNPGPVYYGPSAGATLNNIYQNPTDQAAWCSAVATHIKNTFPTIKTFSALGNEYSSGFSAGDVTLTSPLQAAGFGSYFAYAKACYQAIKAVDPTYIVYGLQLNMDPGAAPLSVISAAYANGCKPMIGVCMDRVSVHLSATGDPQASSAPGATGFITGNGTTIQSIANITALMESNGDPPPYYEFGEGFYNPVVPNQYSQIGSPGQQAYAYARALNAFIQQHPEVVRVTAANLDEDCAYAGQPAFAQNAIIATPTCNPPGGYTVRPAYTLVQQFAGLNPNAPPALAPNTVATPNIVAFVQPVVCGNGVGTLALATAPHTGNIVVAMDVGSTGAVTDSLGTAVPQAAQAADGGGDDVTLHDYVVTGSPTATYTFAAGGGDASCLAEISGGSLSNRVVGTNFTTSNTATLTATATPLTAGAVQLTAVVNPQNGLTGLTLNNSGTVTTTLATPSKYMSNSIATASALTTATASMSTTAGSAALLIVTYN